MDTAIYLNAQEIELFRSFREHQTEFMVLKGTGIFDLKNGSMTVHKDIDGRVRKIETNQILFIT
jgi:hypothetical protein